MSEEWSCPTAGACSARGSDHCTPQDGCTATVESLIGDLAIERGWTNEARDEIARLKAENVQLNQLSIDLRACMFEARHKWGLEQDKNDKLWAVAKAVGLVPVPQEHAGMVRIHSRDWWNIADALATLYVEATDE